MTLYDSLSYHLLFPARWLQEHQISIVQTPFSDPAQAYQPANGELFFLWLMLPFPMTAPRVLPSTTSHKHEPLGPTLEIFARLGMLDLDLNLNHVIERGVSVDDVKAALAARSQRPWIVSGGWCDFYDGAPLVEETFRSVERQVAIAVDLGVPRLRLFFGRLKREEYSAAALATIAGNIRRLADRYPDMLFVLENHDGASSNPVICRQILEAVSRPNIRLNFDPINFEHAGVDSMGALRELLPLVGHVHLKGLDRDGFCEFGAGDVDLMPILRTLLAGGYQGAFTVEYEGRFDRTLRLYQSTQRARTVLADLWHAVPAGPHPDTDAVA